MGTRLVPDRNKMAQYVQHGLTQDQIVEAWVKDGGARVTRNAISLAMKRYKMDPAHTEKRHRFAEQIPWRVREVHTDAYDLRMLRTQARIDHMMPVAEGWLRRLESWKRELDEADAVVHYDPLTEQGFWWVPREESDGEGLIRRPVE